MAGEAIKSFRIFVLRPQADALLRELLLCGVEFTGTDAALLEQLSPEAAADGQSRTEQCVLQNALDILEVCAPEKRKPLFSKKPQTERNVLLEQSGMTAIRQTAERITDCWEAYSSRTAEWKQVRGRIAALQPWETLDVPLDYAGTAQCCVVLGTVPPSVRQAVLEKALAAASDAAVLFPVSAGKAGRYLELLCFREKREACVAALARCGFSVLSFPAGTGIAAQALREAEETEARLRRESEELYAELLALAAHRQELQLGVDRLALQIAAEEKKADLFGTEQTVYLQGLIPARAVELLEAALVRYGCIWELSDYAPEGRKQICPCALPLRYTELKRNL